MKKYLLGIAFAIASIMSCTNEAITISKTETAPPVRDIKCAISSSNFYEKLQADNDIKKLLKEGNQYLGVITLLYGSNGEFVDSTCSYLKVFNGVSNDFNVTRDDEYTVVTIETLVNSDYHYASDKWEIKGMSSLSSLSIHIRDEYIDDKGYVNTFLYWYDAVGVAIETVKVQGGSVSVNIKPEPLGAYVDINYINFDKSNYYFTGFTTELVASGYLLNPSYSEKERYIYKNGYQEKQSFRHGAFSPNYNGATLFVFDTGSLDCRFVYMTEQQYNNWSNSGMIRKSMPIEKGQLYYVGLAYTGESGSPCQSYIASSYDDFNKWKSKLPTPKPASDLLFRQPYTTWGGDVSAVKSYMNDFKLEADIQLSSDGAVYWMQYSAIDRKGNTMIYEYDFDSQSTGLNAVYLVIDKAVTVDEIVSCMEDGGYKHSEDEDGHYFYTINNLVGLFIEDGYYVMLYIKAPDSGTRSSEKSLQMEFNIIRQQYNAKRGTR